MGRIGKRKAEESQDAIPIRTTPRKRKQVNYSNADSESEVSEVTAAPSTSVAKRSWSKAPAGKARKTAAIPDPEEHDDAASAYDNVEDVINGRLEPTKLNADVTKSHNKKGVKVKKGVQSTQNPPKQETGQDDEDESDNGNDNKPKKKRKTKEEKEAEAMPLAARALGLKMYVGAHTSIAKGVENAVTNCVHIGGNAFACFLKSQRKWENPSLKDENKEAFKQHLITHKYDASSHIVPHGSYLVNLASADKDMAKKSYDAFLDDLKRCEALGIKLYNFHPGAAGQAPMPEAIGRLAENLNKALAETTTVIALLENMATRGSIIGGRFQDLRDVIALIKPEFQPRIGVCIDTCHAFASGYDLRTPETFKKTLTEFDEVVGMKYLRAMHLNDSKAPFASNRDLHQNIGLGFLGLRAFHSVMNESRFQNLPLILETPCEKPDPTDKSGKKVLEDKGVWATEIKLLESLIGMDAENPEFQKLEEELSNRGKAERVKMQKQFDEKQAKDAKKLEKEREKGQKNLKDMFGGGKAKGAKKASKGNDTNSESDVE